jgi:glycosyltransferase involved in cell wall biosynthesis
VAAGAPTTRPLVSVIIPTRDRLPMLREAVDSARAQTYARCEIVVLDDGSGDGTWDWLRTQPDLRALRFERPRGPSAARNAAARAARGELLAFLDSDDLFLPHKLRRQVALLQADPRLPLCHSNETWLRDGRELSQKPRHEKRGGWIFEHLLPLCRISPSAAVIRARVFLDQLGGFDEELEVAEDYELWLRLCCRHPVGFVDEPLVIKRGGHPDQLSTRHGQIEKFRIEALARVLRRCPLAPSQRQAALQTLTHKCEIHARGCDRRGRQREAARYRELAVTLART